MNDYILCYPPGSGGRFLSAVLYHITNNLDKPVLIIKNNSGHANKLISGFLITKNISPDHASVFDYLTKVNFKHPTIFLTHAFPPPDLFTKGDTFDTCKLIFITYDEDEFITLLKMV